MSETTTGAIDTRAESSLYMMIWAWLVFLLIAGLVIFVLPIPRTAAVIAIFSFAAIKAALVLRNYMHLKHEHLLIYLMVLVPALLFLGMALTLIPDIVYRHHFGLGQ
ncbi:MAG TPA: cytochrome C oxidase subunit IV family protein [Candidatus Binataceae bacterium]|nr:cytochrome C oxidase subunit IV family protein [Candidatus Binataceae bacterium]